MVRYFDLATSFTIVFGTIMIVFLPLVSNSQRAQIGFDGDSVIRATVLGSKKDSLITDSGAIDLKGIGYIEFQKREISKKLLYQNLKNQGIRISFSPIFHAKMVLADQSIVRGVIYGVEESNITLRKGKKFQTFGLSSIKSLRIVDNIEPGYTVSLSFFILFQVSIGAVIITAQGFSNSGLGPGSLALDCLITPMYALIVQSGRRVYLVANNYSALLQSQQLKKFQTIRNELSTE